jgi:hypothetical protein
MKLMRNILESTLFGSCISICSLPALSITGAEHATTTSVYHISTKKVLVDLINVSQPYFNYLENLLDVVKSIGIRVISWKLF